MPADPLPIKPLDNPPDATVVLPGSKSITNRALLTAALADGATRLSSALFADDTMAMIDGLGALGVDCLADGADGSITVEGRGATFAGAAESTEAVVNARRSGTTSRFLMPVAALRSAPTVIDGDRQLQARPMAHQISALRDLGVSVTELGRPRSSACSCRGPDQGASLLDRGRCQQSVRFRSAARGGSGGAIGQARPRPRELAVSGDDPGGHACLRRHSRGHRTGQFR